MAAGGKIILKLSFQDVFILLVFLKLPNLLHQKKISGIYILNGKLFIVFRKIIF